MELHSSEVVPETTPWQLIIKDKDYALATWREIFAVVWRKETTMEGAVHLRAACNEFASRHPRGIGLLTIIAANAPLPPSAERKAIADFLAAGSHYIKCSAVIIEGTGFRAAAVRSVVTGLTMLAQQSYPHSVCDDDSAVRMFAKELPRATGRPLNAAALRLSFDDLRKKVQL